MRNEDDDHPDSLDDAELARRARGRDAEAFRALFERYERMFWSYLVGKVGRTEADEISQEAWLRIWKNLGRFDGGNFRAWGFQIVRNLVADGARRPRLSVAGHAEGEDVADPRTRDPIDGLIDDEHRAEFERCWTGLKDEERSVLGSLLDGLNYQEIVELLRLPIERLYKIRENALRKLRGCLGRAE